MAGRVCLCAALAACNYQHRRGSHDGGTGGLHGERRMRPAIHIDGGTVRRGSVRLVVPAYYTPGADWDRIIAASDVVGMIIFNPNNGPGTTTDPAYVGDRESARRRHPGAGIRRDRLRHSAPRRTSTPM